MFRYIIILVLVGGYPASDGSVWFGSQSEVGKGSTFTVRVPVVYEEG